MTDVTALYDADGPAPLRLTVGRCRACGASFFPPQRYGCEQCGAHGDALETRPTAGVGRVLEAVTVFKHRGPGPAAPFGLATVLLDDGPELRGFLTAPCPVAAGTRVTAVLVPEAANGGLPPVRFQTQADGGAP